MRLPTDEELDVIAKWKPSDCKGLVDYITGLWWLPDRNIKVVESEDRYTLHLKTMSWRGHEEIIHALMDNIIFWHRHWRQTDSAGEYTFVFYKKKNFEL